MKTMISLGLLLAGLNGSAWACTVSVSVPYEYPVFGTNELSRSQANHLDRSLKKLGCQRVGESEKAHYNIGLGSKPNTEGSKKNRTLSEDVTDSEGTVLASKKIYDFQSCKGCGMVHTVPHGRFVRTALRLLDQALNQQAQP